MKWKSLLPPEIGILLLVNTGIINSFCYKENILYENRKIIRTANLPLENLPPGGISKMIIM